MQFVATACKEDSVQPSYYRHAWLHTASCCETEYNMWVRRSVAVFNYTTLLADTESWWQVQGWHGCSAVGPRLRYILTRVSLLRLITTELWGLLLLLVLNSVCGALE